jgi:ATP-dependent protease ClpP protease subunit
MEPGRCEVRSVYPLKCQIRAESGVTRVDVYDDIGEGGFFSGGLSAKGFAAQLRGVKGPLEVHINSGGGDVFDGIAIGNAIRKHKGMVTTVNDGVAASIASVILQAGRERVVEPGSMVMVHDAFGMCIGNAAEMAKMTEVLDKNSDNIASIYAERAGGTPAEWRATMKDETWYTAEEAVDAGLADRVGAGAAVVPDGLDLAAFETLPGRIAAALRTLPAAAATHEPMTGTHSHPHPAYGSQGGDAMHAHEHTHDGDARHSHSHVPEPGGDAGVSDRLRAAGGCGCCEMCTGLGDGCCSMCVPQNAMHNGHQRIDPDGDGDCDACPEGDTDHDYWSADGTQLKPVPGNALEERIRAMVFDALAAAADGVDNSPWDASKAWHNGASSDDPAAFYAGICAGRKDGDKAAQDAWALPYKYTPSSPPNAAGVKNALSRLPQTQGLTNEAAAKSLLQGLMKKINPDYEPADYSGPEWFRDLIGGSA